MNEQLLAEIVSELHNINLNLIELTNVIKGKNNASDKHEPQDEPINIDLESLFSNTLSTYCICDDCVENNDGCCSKNMPLYKKCQICMHYMNDAVYRPILPEGTEQI